mmetsp:Transcript_8519/g.24439  ORF Transcript_8519/g.24439 Transcript_8519/m.24439 type:complete len:271 (-) Transcript_8519:129-941(-)|eukprot:CAMPEP_0117677984 /NCGR_PEP_ID=MMETSP0804-20121206/17036_1 /TAXON_ID=1074897 /ORGANISM="Tetraselmis astigmatica, Strain CCMP880" /LENGTH=270 /DNA_ID=CAMNT_0005487303 /DNA_START=361 /DNA_END=1173 /DNA_ORIENTATION=-
MLTGSTLDLAVTYGAPLLGVVLGTIMVCSPMRAVLAVQKSGHLGDLNPLPFPIISANCASWIVYSLMKRDWFIYIGNLPGLIVGLLFTMTTLACAPPQIRSQIKALFLLLVFEICIVSAAIGMYNRSPADKLYIWGLNTNIILLLYYAAPLSAMYRVIQDRSAASLNWPMSLANLANGTTWFVYGLYGLNDPWIWAPNGIGASLALVQVSAFALYPATPAVSLPRQAMYDHASCVTSSKIAPSRVRSNTPGSSPPANSAQSRLINSSSKN